MDDSHTLGFHGDTSVKYVDIRVIQKVNWTFPHFDFSLSESSLVNLTHIYCVGTPQWPTLGMVEALVCGLESGGDNGG